MKSVSLNNNVTIPVLGLGTFMISPSDTEKAVYTAIKEGYRLIDTANAYMNEEAVGRAVDRAIREGIVKREDLFISTKLWPTVYEDENAIEKTISRLGLDYIDLLFIHQPAGNFVAGYRNMEEAYRKGKTRSLGISNMHGEKLEKLLSSVEIAPQVIQLEAHPYCSEKDLMDRLSEYGTKLMSWYPLGHGDKNLINEEVFAKLSDKYHKSNVQIILRWHIQKGFIVIPGSKDPEHIRSNFDIFDFSLTDEEMNEIEKLDGTKKYYMANEEMEERYATMHLPFES